MCAHSPPSHTHSTFPHRRHVLYCAIFSRLFVFLISFLINLLQVPDYDTSSQIASIDPNPKPGDKLIQEMFGRFVKWDAIYFVRIAERGYEYEQFYAFYPFYPMLVRSLAKGAQFLLGWWASERSLLIASGFFISNFTFVLSAIELYKLGCVVMRDENTSFISSILYTINPASIFMSAVYTESTFALFAFTALYFLSTRQYILSSLFFFFCTATRSNGILFAGFIIFRTFYVFWHQIFAFFVTRFSSPSNNPATPHARTTNDQFRKVVKSECSAPPQDADSPVWLRVLSMGFMLAATIAPMGLFQLYGTQYFCAPEFQDTRPYCRDWFFPSLYGYVQNFYWNQGFFHYYERKQIPNFLLAGPMIVLSIYGIYTYFYNRITHIRRLYNSPKSPKSPKPPKSPNNTNNSNISNISNKSNNNSNNNNNTNDLHDNNQKHLPEKEQATGYLGPQLLPYVLYWAIILGVSLTCMHVQVITRFFSSCPAVYWFCGYVFLHKKTYPTTKKAILGYFLFYVLVGTCLFGLYYPWT